MPAGSSAADKGRVKDDSVVLNLRTVASCTEKSQGGLKGDEVPLRGSWWDCVSTAKQRCGELGIWRRRRQGGGSGGDRHRTSLQ